MQAPRGFCALGKDEVVWMDRWAPEVEFADGRMLAEESCWSSLRDRREDAITCFVRWLLLLI